MSDVDILLEAGTNELEIVEFFIDEGPGRGCSAFGVNVAKVIEVVESPGLSPLPGAPHPSFMGNIPLRGMALPVLDLAVWLDLPRTPRPNEVILVTCFAGRTIGFLASGVANIHRVRWTDVAPPPALTRLGDNSLTGLVSLQGRFIQLLDLEKILYTLDGSLHDGQDAPPPSATRRRALVAEDSGLMRHLLRQRLETANIEVVMADNGRQALDILGRPGAVPPDIVISDIEMPLLDGYALTRAIREDPALRRLPVILFSSLITDELRHKGESVGADAQIAKPQFADLARLALSLIEARTRSSGS